MEVTPSGIAFLGGDTEDREGIKETAFGHLDCPPFRSILHPRLDPSLFSLKYPL